MDAGSFVLIVRAVLLIVLAAPFAAASPVEVAFEQGREPENCYSYSWGGNTTWDRFDGPRYFNQSYYETRCSSSSSGSVTATHEGEEVAHASHSNETSFLGWRRDYAAGGKPWEGPGDDRWESTQTVTDGSSSDETHARALTLAASSEKRCSEQTNTGADRIYVNGTSPEGGPSYWARDWGWNDRARHCSDATTFSFNGTQIARVERRQDCASNAWSQDLEQDYVWNGRHHLIYDEGASASDCGESTTVSAAGEELARAGRYERCEHAHSGRIADWQHPEDGFANNISERTGGCESALYVEAAGARYSEGNQTAWYEQCYAEPGGRIDYCYHDERASSGKRVTGPNGATIFVGEESHEATHCNAHSGCHNDERYRFEGARVEWDDAPTGPIRHEQPLMLP